MPYIFVERTCFEVALDQRFTLPEIVSKTNSAGISLLGRYQKLQFPNKTQSPIVLLDPPDALPAKIAKRDRR
jgi:hypothetical protein